MFFYLFISHDTIFLPFLRNESGQLRKENEELRLRLQRALIRLEDLDNQSDQHGRVHEKMKERLKKMDDYAQEQGQQVIIVYEFDNISEICRPILMFTVELPLMACKNLYEMTLHCFIWICNAMEMGFIILNAKFFYFHRSWICCPSRVRC